MPLPSRCDDPGNENGSQLGRSPRRRFDLRLDKFVHGNDEVLRVYAVDVYGFRLTFVARVSKRTTAADCAERELIIKAIKIEPWGVS
jgi:hypothetical protein